MNISERIDKYLTEELRIEYDLTFDERMEGDVEKLVKKMKGELDDPDFDYGDARANAYIPKVNAKKFEKGLDIMGVDWS